MNPTKPTGRRDLQAFGIATVVEAVLLSAAAVVVAWSAPPPSPPAPVVIQLTQAEPEPPKPEPPKPRLREPMPHPAPIPIPAPRPVPQALPPPQAPSAFSEPVPPPPPPPAPNPSPASKPDPGLEYSGRVRAAVQAAVIYPAAAATMNFSGRARVEFLLRDGVPSRIQVIHGSGLGMIDRAAIKSVQEASFPPPPAGLQGKELSYQVWVEFVKS